MPIRTLKRNPSPRPKRLHGFILLVTSWEKIQLGFLYVIMLLFSSSIFIKFNLYKVTCLFHRHLWHAQYGCYQGVTTLLLFTHSSSYFKISVALKGDKSEHCLGRFSFTVLSCILVQFLPLQISDLDVWEFPLLNMVLASGHPNSEQYNHEDNDI